MKPQLLVGPPGTGKTTELLRIVDRALADGVPPERIAALTFTKMGAETLITRAVDKFKHLSTNQFPYVRTMHSLAFHLRKLERDRVLTKDHMDTFCKKVVGFDFNRHYDAMAERTVPGGAKGDRCARVYQISKVMETSYFDAWRDHGDKIEWKDFEYFCEHLDRYKKVNELVDYCDFLDTLTRPLDVDLFIVDEAQDLTRQQWDVIKNWSASSKQIIFAGDDDQSIFEWAGADLASFQALSANSKTLPVSYRLPVSVFEICTKIARQIKCRLPKEWKPRDEMGEVRFPWTLEEIDLKGEESWLLLCRNQYNFRDFERMCRLCGVPYVRHDGRWSTNTKGIRAILAYETLRNGEKISADDALNVVKHVLGARMADLHRDVFWSDIRFPFHGKPTWMEALTLLSPDEREYVRLMKSNGERLNKKPRITISTIHGAKGAEADNVVLLTDCSRAVEDALHTNPDEELRVWYVGCSRAKNRMFVVGKDTSTVHNLISL